MNGFAAALRARPLLQPVRTAVLAGWLAAAPVVGLLSACGGLSLVDARVAPAVRTALSSNAFGDRELASFYAARANRPLWVGGAGLRPEAHALVAQLAHADRHGLDPARYGMPHILAALVEAKAGTPASLARAELMLSRAFADYVLDLHRPIAGAEMIVTDRSLAPARLTRRAVLEAAGEARSLRRHLAEVQRMSPLYDELVRGLADYRARWSALPRVHVTAGRTLSEGSRGERVRLLRQRLGQSIDGAGASRFDASLADAVREFQAAHGLAPTGGVDTRTVAALNAGPERYERLIIANLERARALPAGRDGRHIVVDAGSAMLRLYDDGEVRDSMRVVVGKTSQQTPIMSGMIRFAMLNPYWNLPPDLTQERAGHVLRQGVDYLRREKLEALSGWEERARVLLPSEIDWKAVASGRQKLRMRQLPGPHNVMGAIKFMLPNRLGIYLHDTGDKTGFAQADRWLSSGCVRVADAPRLARWLFNGRPPASLGNVPEQRVDLPKPVPVYITYLTAEPRAGGIAFRPDLYKRDSALLAQLESRTLLADSGSRPKRS